MIIKMKTKIKDPKKILIKRFYHIFQDLIIQVLLIYNNMKKNYLKNLQKSEQWKKKQNKQYKLYQMISILNLKKKSILFKH